MKTVDEIIKGMDPNKEVTATDIVNFDNAYYVSKNDNTQSLESIDAVDKGSNNAMFESFARKVKKDFGDKPVIVGAIDATHYNFVNANVSYYDIDYIKPNSKTWIVKADAGNWGRPIQINHDSDQEMTIGRVLGATPFIYPNVNPNNLVKPDGHIEIIYYVVDTNAIDRIMDGRYRTMSVSAGAKLTDVTCSICKRAINDYECPHIRGKIYDNEDTGKKELCFWKWTNKRYSESSFVTKPADQGAVNKKVALINVPGVDAEDNISYNYSMDAVRADSDSTKIIPKFSIMVGSMDGSSNIHNLRTSLGESVPRESIFIQDSIVSNDVKIINDEKDNTGDNHTTMGTEEKSSDVNDDCPTCNDTDDKSGDAGDKGAHDSNITRDKNAELGLLTDMLEKGLITLEDAIELAYEYADVHIPNSVSSDLQGSIDFLNNILDQRDAKLTTAKRKKMSSSTFCGPNRSFPVPDCAHVTAARRLIGRYKGSAATKSRIMACVNRKAKAMSCSTQNGKKTKDNINQEVAGTMDNMKYQFASEKELLDCSIVQKAMDTITSDFEQKMDTLKNEADEKETRFKTIAADSIIDMSIKLNKPLTASLAKAESDDFTKIRKEVSDKLLGRTIESLADTLTDLNDEASAKHESSDSSQAAVDKALGNKVAGKDDEAKDGEDDKGAGDNKGGESSDSSTPQPKEELNQGDSTDADKDNKSILPSFTRKKK